MENKKLTALEALEQLRQNNKDDSHLFDDELLDIIEKQLKALEHINKRLKNELFEYEDKEIKALDIIKSWLSDRIIRFDEDLIVIRLTNNYCNPTDDTFYYYIVPEQEKEQIKLLKEVLK